MSRDPMLAEVAERIRAAVNTEKLAAEQVFGDKRDQLQARVTAAVQAIEADGHNRAQSLHAELQHKEQEVRNRFSTARTAIAASRDVQKAAAVADEQAAVAELRTAIAAKRCAATEASTQEATLVFEAGRTQADRARAIVTSTHSAIDAAASHAVSGANAPNADVRSAVQTKVSESSRSIKEDVREKGNNVARGATETAETVARSIHQAGTKLASSIHQGAADVERSIRGGTVSLVEQIEQQAQESLAKLEEGETQFAAGLTDARAQLVPGIQTATQEAVQRMQQAGDQAISGLEVGRATATAGFDQAATQVLGQLNGAGDDVLPEDAVAFESQATAAFAQLRTSIATQLEQATANIGTGIQTAQDGFGQALDQQQTEIRQRVDHAVSETRDIAHAPQAWVERCQQGREQLLQQRRQGIQQWGTQANGKITEARTGWTKQRTQADREVRGKVDEFRTQSTQLISTARTQFASAAASAVTSASGSWLSKAWHGIKEGFSRFFDGMKWFLLAFVIVFAACVIVMAVIAGGISIAVIAAAAALALTIVGIGFLIYGLISSAIHRIGQWIAAPQPWWAKIICIPYLLAVIIGDVLGVTPLLEGIFGHDAISLDELTTKERWARATVGVLSILALLIMRRAGKAMGARGSGWRGPGRARPVVDPNAPPVVDPNAPPVVDPNAPPVVDPNAPPDPNRPPVEPNPPRPAYDPAGRTMAQLQGDRNPRPRVGETPAEAATRSRLAQDEILRRAPEIMDQLGNEPRRVNVHAEEPAREAQGAHTVLNHGSDIPLRVADNPGGKTIEGRVTDPVGPGWDAPNGDPTEPTNLSFKWISDAVMNNVINNYIRTNWEAIRTDLALEGRHAIAFDSGNLAGEGFVNEGMGGAGPRNPVFGRTSLVRLVLLLDPGPPANFFVYTAFPNFLGTPAH